MLWETFKRILAKSSITAMTALNFLMGFDSKYMKQKRFLTFLSQSVGAHHPDFVSEHSFHCSFQVHLATCVKTLHCSENPNPKYTGLIDFISMCVLVMCVFFNKAKKIINYISLKIHLMFSSVWMLYLGYITGDCVNDSYCFLKINRLTI